MRKLTQNEKENIRKMTGDLGWIDDEGRLNVDCVPEWIYVEERICFAMDCLEKGGCKIPSQEDQRYCDDYMKEMRLFEELQNRDRIRKFWEEIKAVEDEMRRLREK